MSTTKKPDQIVFDEESQRYDAALKPYATGVGAPKITATDTVAWKNKNIHKVNHQINTKYLELKAAYEDMMQQFEYNNLIYGARFNFEPVVGETYHLYRDRKEEPFLSVIAPHECTFDFVGSFRLNADQMWERTNLGSKPTKNMDE
ncbi:DUF2452 domain-containing protein [Sediminicola sp. 1XM1-17]|uniref:DUF2452 domain-containing protein n=1 Tax=Sediminicola sp. 1XM1-17 TaxID=3127702 RepID=UPI00307839DE